MIIDTHSHLNFKAYDVDREKVIKRIQKEGLVCIDVGTKYETSEKAVKLAEKYNNIFAAVGMHPIYTAVDFIKIKTDPEEESFLVKKERFNKEKYRKLANSDKVVAIGEIGLDYYYKPKSKGKLEKFKEKQREIFLEQLELAKELNLPTIIHCRMAHQDLISNLKSQFSKSQLKSQNCNIKGVIHCFTGTIEEMKQYLDLGFYIGFNGIIFKLDLAEAIKKCPMEKILVETDCPYLTPPEQGNKRNEPIFIKYIIQKIAEIKNISYKEIAEKTFLNAKRLFNLPD